MLKMHNSAHVNDAMQKLHKCKSCPDRYQ